MTIHDVLPAEVQSDLLNIAKNKQMGSYTLNFNADGVLTSVDWRYHRDVRKKSTVRVPVSRN